MRRSRHCGRYREYSGVRSSGGRRPGRRRSRRCRIDGGRAGGARSAARTESAASARRGRPAARSSRMRPGAASAADTYESDGATSPPYAMGSPGGDDRWRRLRRVPAPPDRVDRFEGARLVSAAIECCAGGRISTAGGLRGRRRRRDSPCVSDRRRRASRVEGPVRPHPDAIARGSGWSGDQPERLLRRPRRRWWTAGRRHLGAGDCGRNHHRSTPLRRSNGGRRTGAVRRRADRCAVRAMDRRIHVRPFTRGQRVDDGGDGGGAAGLRGARASKSAGGRGAGRTDRRHAGDGGAAARHRARGGGAVCRTDRRLDTTDADRSRSRTPARQGSAASACAR